MNRRFALLIGNSIYDDPTLSRLKTPESDVRGFAEVLRNPRICNFDQVDALIDRPYAEVQMAVADLLGDKSPKDIVLLYFSGHGVLDENGCLYFAVRDTRRDRISASALSCRFIVEEMAKSRSRRQVLLLDCCHSGAFARGAKGAIELPAVTQATFEGNGYGRVVITATDATQYAWEGDQIIGEAENSLFTHFLLNGLETGNADNDLDGVITIDELHDFIYEQITHVTTRQKPRKWVYKQEGRPIVIATNLVLLCQFDAVHLGAWTNHPHSPMHPASRCQNWTNF